MNYLKENENRKTENLTPIFNKKYWTIDKIIYYFVFYKVHNFVFKLVSPNSYDIKSFYFILNVWVLARKIQPF